MSYDEEEQTQPTYTYIPYAGEIVVWEEAMDRPQYSTREEAVVGALEDIGLRRTSMMDTIIRLSVLIADLNAAEAKLKGGNNV